MGLRGTIFLLFFGVAIIACLFNPFWGVLAYFGHYFLWPEKQWWGELLAANGIRVSFSIVVVWVLSTVAHWSRIKANLGGPVIHKQEVLFWAYVAVVGLSALWAVTPNPEYVQGGTPPFEKMYKLAVVAFLVTHIVSSTKDVRRLILFFATVGGVYLGWTAREVPSSQYADGRLEGIGGPDFGDANFLGTHFVVMGVLLGALLFTERKLWLKCVCLSGGGLVVNALILTRSRGAFLALGAVVVCALFSAPRELRKRLLLWTPVFLVAAFLLTDTSYWERIGTVTADESERDASAQGRLDLWKGAMLMAGDYPLGVGAGNFYSEIGQYAPEHPGRDAHSTIFRTLGETGVLGLLLILALVGNALWITEKVKRQAIRHEETRQFAILTWGIQLSIITLFVGGLTITMTYIEEFFIVLLLPICCERALNNELQRLNESCVQEESPNFHEQAVNVH